MPVLLWLAVLLGGYILGCFNTAYYLVRWQSGTDVRDLGSGNAGARNAGRVLGRRGFALALGGDALKGSFAVLAARALGLGPAGEMAALLAAVAGHLWPAQLGWRGGKGAATAFGGLAAAHPLLALEVLGTALIGQTLTRSYAAAGLVAMLAAPGLAWSMGLDAVTLTGIALLAVLLLLTHRTNLRKLFVRLRVKG
jgi:glycerol-3-phosphate acyltransferase PlsY